MQMHLGCHRVVLLPRTTTYGAGTAFNSLETVRVRFQEKMRNRQYERKGLLPQQILQQRLSP